MRKFTVAVLAGAALCIAGSGAALAADLPARAPGPVYKAPVVYAPYNWTGLYGGINFGGGWGRSNWSAVPSGSFRTSGAVVGGTLGYNWQNGPMVLGLEGDIDWADIRGEISCVPNCNTKTDWLGTARVRAGFAFNRWLPYVTGGLAAGDIKASGNGPLFPGRNVTKAGWTVGGGLEAALIGNWTAKVEYLYVDLGSMNCAAGVCAGPATNVDHKISLVRSGFNYRF